MMNPASVLGYGAIGLGFLLAYLAYRLLGQEQRAAQPRPEIMRAIYAYEFFSVILVFFGVILEYHNNSSEQKAQAGEAKLERLNDDLVQARIELSKAQVKADEATSCKSSRDEALFTLAGTIKIVTNAKGIIGKLQKRMEQMSSLAATDACSGGPHGIPTNNSGQIQTLTTAISSDVANVKGILDPTNP